MTLMGGTPGFLWFNLSIPVMRKKNGGVPAVDRRPSVYDLHPTYN